MNLTFTTLSLSILTLLSLSASIVAVAWLVFPQIDQGWRRLLHTLLPVIAIGTGGVFAYRVLAIHHSWQPLESHVDGLLLIGAMVATMLSFLQTRRRLESISAFVMPILTLLLVWAIFASSWSYQGLSMDSIWATFHRLGVYLGSVFYLVAAGAGVMFLYVSRQLRAKRVPGMLDRLPSLEAVEHLIIQTATLGFALISLGLVTGVIYTTSRATSLGDGWWYSPKVILATIAWLIYAVVMNVRFAQTFRGSRAAWLSIVGLLFVLATFVAALTSSSQAETISPHAAQSPVMEQQAPPVDRALQVDPSPGRAD